MIVMMIMIDFAYFFVLRNGEHKEILREVLRQMKMDIVIMMQE